MKPTVFTVEPEHLGSLGASEAVSFFSELLWAEARRIGINVTRIDISSRINAPDGGVDASFDGPLPASDTFLQSGPSTYQIKAGTTFKPAQESAIKEALLIGKKRDLAPGVKACLDAGGSYTLVCTGTDPTKSELDDAMRHMRAILAAKGYQDPNVAVWGQNKLIAALGSFPSLAIRVNGSPTALFKTHSVWASQAEMRRDLQLGAAQTQFIEGLQTELRRTDRATHIHVQGEAGIGKTRLVLEATGADDLRPLVLYFENPDEAAKRLVNHVVFTAKGCSAIVVVDECGSQDRASLWNQLQNEGPRIKLVTISLDVDDVGGTTQVVSAPGLDLNEVTAIIRDYGVPEDHARRKAEFCDGSPRVAHVLGQNLRDNPGDLLKGLDTIPVWERYIAGTESAASEAFRQRQLVLRYLSLFRKVGFKGPVAEEAKAIAKLVEKADPQLTWHRFQEIVAHLKERRILQGESSLYITPKLLQIKLWTDWWKTHGADFDLQAFTADLPAPLFDALLGMFRYARESKSALAVAKGFLGVGGLFDAEAIWQEEWACRFFVLLAEAAPDEALACLKRTVGMWTPEKLRAFTNNRQHVVWALERIAMWKGLFFDASQVLLRLAAAENATHSNNATGTFSGLFYPGPGLTLTEADPKVRFEVLKSALESSCKEERMVALVACDNALGDGGIRILGAEHQGLRQPPQFWRPTTWGDLTDAYERVWELVMQRLPHLPADEEALAVKTLLDRLRDLERFPSLFPMLHQGLTTIADERGKRREVLKAIEETLHYDGEALEESHRRTLEELRDRLVQASFASRLERYVGMDLMHDQFDESGTLVDSLGPHIDSLVNESIQSPDLLVKELGSLVGETSSTAYRFGRELALRDPEFSFLPAALDAQRQAQPANAMFLCGYLSAVFELSAQRWEQTLDSMASDPELRNFVPEVTWRSGMSDTAADRVLKLVGSGHVPAHALRIFAFGGVVGKIPEPSFINWIDFLLAQGSRPAATTALSLFFYYYGGRKITTVPPKELARRVVSAEAFFASSTERQVQMEDYEWSETASGFLERHPEEGIALGRKLIASFGIDGTITAGFHSRSHSVLTQISKMAPSETWDEIAKYLGPPLDTRSFHLRAWLRDGGLVGMNPADVWRWVDQDLERRAWLAASIVPPTLTAAAGNQCWAREILLRYGHREDVRRNLVANFSTEGWVGPESSHLAGRRRQLLEQRDVEKEQRIRQWIEEFVEGLDKRIELAQIEEERENR